MKKKYGIVSADPAWSYNDKLLIKGANGHTNGAAAHYPTMTLDAIKQLPVADIADESCILFLWATMPLLPDAFEVIRA